MSSEKAAGSSKGLMMGLTYSRQVAGGHVISRRTQLVSSILSLLISITASTHLNRNKVKFISSVRLNELLSEVRIYVRCLTPLVSF